MSSGRSRLTRWLRRTGAAAAVLLLLLGILDLYARLPARFTVPPPDIPPGTRTLVLIFHGMGGSEEPALIALTERLREFAREEPDTVVLFWRWAPQSESRFRAHARGARLGAGLGAWLGQLTELQELHLIAHSAGAFVVEPLCDHYREVAGARSPRGAAPARVVMTLLDPSGIRGAVEMGWGARHLGRCADFAQAFINTDDPAFATNAFLQEAWNVDVTGVPGRQHVNGHLWPVLWFLGRVAVGDLRAAGRNHGDYPRGAVAGPGAVDQSSD